MTTVLSERLTKEFDEKPWKKYSADDLFCTDETLDWYIVEYGFTPVWILSYGVAGKMVYTKGIAAADYQGSHRRFI